MLSSRTGGSRAGAGLLWREIQPIKALTTASLIMLMINVVATLAGPLLVQDFVDLAIGGASPGALVRVSLMYLGVALLSGGARVTASYFGVQCGWRLADSLRMKLLRRAAVETPILKVEARPVGEVLEQVEGSADIVGRSIAESGFRLVGNIAVVVGILGVMVVKVPAAGLGITLLVVGLCFALARLSRIAVGRWERARNQQAELFGFIGDALAARNDLLPMGESAWATARVHDDLAALYHTEGRAYIGGRGFWPLTQLFVALAFGLGVGFALQRLGQGAISVGTLAVVYLYIDLLQKPLEEMSSQAGQLQQMMGVLAIAARVLDAGHAPEPTSADPPAILPDGPLAVSFEDVTFGYGDEPVLQEVSFTVPAGRSLGVVGRTGAGKSTIVNLLCGLARPQSGRVRIGGIDTHELSDVEFARRVTVMSQRAHVFGASVRDNVTLFDAAVPEEHVWEVLERLNAADWVRALPDGVDTPIGTGGRRLSEGELQLLAGARALIRPYSLLVVDEGTSRLDPETEQSWAELLDGVMDDRTVVVIEHRWGTLRSVDEVLVLDEGRVADLLPGSAALAARKVTR